MTVRWEMLLLIAACMAVTIIPRITPLMLADRIKLPAWFRRWLENVPVAIMAALFFREALLADGDWRALSDPYLLAAAPTALIALMTRSLFATVFCGMAVFSLLRLL